MSGKKSLVCLSLILALQLGRMNDLEGYWNKTKVSLCANLPQSWFIMTDAGGRPATAHSCVAGRQKEETYDKKKKKKADA